MLLRIFSSESHSDVFRYEKKTQNLNLCCEVKMFD